MNVNVSRNVFHLFCVKCMNGYFSRNFFFHFVKIVVCYMFLFYLFRSFETFGSQVSKWTQTVDDFYGFLYYFQGFIWDIAPFFNAMVIFAEHRYYGQSLPYGNKSLTPGKIFIVASPSFWDSVLSQWVFWEPFWNHLVIWHFLAKIADKNPLIIYHWAK